MSEIIGSGSNSVIDGRSEDGKFFVRETFYDDKALEKNHRLKLSGVFQKPTLGLHDDADTRAMISCPSAGQWEVFKKKHFDTYKLLTTRGQSDQDNADRMRGFKQLQILHPGWIIFERI